MSVARERLLEVNGEDICREPIPRTVSAGSPACFGFRMDGRVIVPRKGWHCLARLRLPRSTKAKLLRAGIAPVDVELGKEALPALSR